MDSPGLCVNLCPLASMCPTHSVEPGHTRASYSAGLCWGLSLFLSGGGLVRFLQFRCRGQASPQAGAAPAAQGFFTGTRRLFRNAARPGFCSCF